ncbi:hypothetical protein MUK42_27741 [Musa troglodytarum]|uniref:Uncharacterized protein n=1 Tax=Musa troglodytarum TaxID=320322 RepID=A0A9E7JQS7_9LILI|nr:hypothetical protein MUK42_27741 [Musa troglodytarum]
MGTQPLEGYYVTVFFDLQMVLLLVDLAKEAHSKTTALGVADSPFLLNLHSTTINEPIIYPPSLLLQMGWLQSLVSPVKKLWIRLHSAHKKKRGIYILYEDVKSCPYEDVHVLWSILAESHAPQLQLKQ